MELEKIENTHKTNDTQKQSYDFEIGDASVVIDILRNRIYAHPIRTLVQEYICNARDANREAGKDDHLLLIHAPTEENPVFKVRDYGNGIDHERMTSVFIKYGSSTKRKNNQQTGGFGIGAKSAWAYTDSFTIVTVMDGKKRCYCAHVGSNQQGTLEFISETDTNEENGTEITVGLKSTAHVDDFQTAIQRCIVFWDERPRVDNLQSKSWFEDNPVLDHEGVKLIEPFNENFRIFNSASVPIIAVDGIPYETQCYNDFRLKKRIVVHCKTREVGVQASRESLDDSDQNKIYEIIKRAVLRVQKLRSQEIESSENVFEFFKTFNFWEKLTDDVNASKFGFHVRSNGYIYDDNNDVVRVVKWTYDKRTDRLKTVLGSGLRVKDVIETPVILLDDPSVVQKIVTSRVKHYIKQKNVESAIGFSLEQNYPELVKVKVSEIQVPKQTRTKKNKVAASTKRHSIKKFNLHGWTDTQMSTEELVNSNEKYLFIDAKSNRIHEYKRLCLRSDRVILGAGKQTLKVLEKLRKAQPSRFCNEQDFLSNIKTEIGVQRQESFMRAVRVRVFKSLENYSRLSNLLSIKNIDNHFELIEDADIRNKLCKTREWMQYKTSSVSDSLNQIEPSDLPSSVVEAFASHTEVSEDVKTALQLEKMIKDVLPFFDYYSDEMNQKGVVALLKCFNFLLKERAL